MQSLPHFLQTQFTRLPYHLFAFVFLGFLVFSETLSFADQSVTIDFPRDFLGISMLEQPNKYYFIICGHKIVLEVDSSILLIMEKLQSYNSKVALHFKVHFVLRVPRFLFLCFCSLNLLWWFCREWCINRVTFKWESLKLFLVKHKVSKELWLSCLNSELYLFDESVDVPMRNDCEIDVFLCWVWTP